MADNGNEIPYPSTITGALPGDIHAVADPHVPPPALGLEKQISNYRPQGAEHQNNLPLGNYIPRDNDQQKG